MQGKIVLVTGGTGGIGFETAKGLAAQGAAITLVGRDPQRGAEAVRQIQQATGNQAVHYLSGDLSHQAGIEQFAAAFRQQHERLDVLVNNAGAIFWERKENRDGFEMTFALNHLGYFYLTHLLLPLLLKSSPARIVNVSSDAHRGGKINFGDLQLASNYSAWRAYSQSKLANILFTRELARRLAGHGVTVNTLHPGFVKTDFGNGGGLFSRLFGLLAGVAAISPEKGAETSIYLAASPEVATISGEYFDKKRVKQAAAAATNEAAAQRLWAESMALLGIDEPYGGLAADSTP